VVEFVVVLVLVLVVLVVLVLVVLAAVAVLVVEDHCAAERLREHLCLRWNLGSDFRQLIPTWTGHRVLAFG
jgi:hypothetical protein